MISGNYINYGINFGSHKQFKRLFQVCAYSGQTFEPKDTKTLEHIVPQIRGGKKELPNLVVVKRSVNCLRSDTPLGEFMDKYPWVLENILKTLEELKGKVIDGVNWAQEVRVILFKETGKEVFNPNR